MQKENVHAFATVPEHSIYFMEAVSGGKAFVEDNYVFYHNDNWLSFIAYPLNGDYSHESFLLALKKALEFTRASFCYSISPDLPAQFKNDAKCIDEEDLFYHLPIAADIPKKLINPIKKASSLLTIEFGNEFTREHRRLWTEFMARTPLKPRVRNLFASVESLFSENNVENKKLSINLLNAWNEEGRLVASLLIDFAPKKFCSYILGAHSKSFYIPHAHDALFAKLLEIAKEKNKEYIDLGLGVNEGITRFKKKWGAIKAQSFIMATLSNAEAFKALSSARNQKEGLKFHVQSIIKGLAEQNDDIDILDFVGKSKWEMWTNLPKQKPYAMLWEITKNGRTSWIGGSAHFFCYSFTHSFKKLFDRADTVLFEGPLDEESLRLVNLNGLELTNEHQALYSRFNNDEIQKLSQMVRGKEDVFTKLLNADAKRKIDVEWYLKNTRPWTALFSLWTAYLERNDWHESVDLEAWHLAHEMGKIVVAMESLEEQLDSLNSVPPERVVRYFQDCHLWPSMIKQNIKNYLAGDLMGLCGTSAEFPTRTKKIISHRDERFRQRMRPFIEEGRAVVFVGTAHMINLREMLEEDGFKLRQIKI